MEALQAEEINCGQYQFTLLGANDPNALVQWNFGNGVVLTEIGTSIIYTYPENGNFTVIATYQGEDCDGQEIMELLSVECGGGNGCPTNWVYEEIACGVYTFSIPNLPNNATVSWNLNGFFVNNNGSPVTQEFAPGSYMVYAIYQSPGCPPVTFFTQLIVEECPDELCPTEIIVSELNECGLYAFHLNGFPGFGDISWMWGDGGSNVGANGVTHAYPEPGTYEVCVVASNEDCPQGVEICIPLVVEGCDIPCPEGIEVVQLGCGLYGFEVGSAASVSGAGWVFGDGVTEMGGHYITHQFSEPGVYVVQVNSMLTIPCFNNYFVVTIVVEECEESCIEGLNFTQMACGYYYFSAPESNTDQYVQWNYTIGNEEYNMITQGNGFVSQVFPQGVYEVCGTYFSLECPDGATFCQVLEVPNCNGMGCILEIEANTNNGSGYWFEASEGSLTPQYWLLPNGEIYQGPSWEQEFNEPGTYTICATFYNPMCGELEDCVTITVEEECTNVNFGLDSFVMDGGPLQSAWTLYDTDGLIIEQGSSVYSPNDPYYDFSTCLPDGCYYLSVSGFSTQQPDAFNVFFSENIEVVAQTEIMDGSTLVLNYFISINGDCGSDPCFMEVSAVSEDGFNYLFFVEPGNGLQPMGWELPDGTFVSGAELLYTFTETGTYEICAFNESLECGLVTDCITLVVEDTEECYLTTLTVSAEFSEFELQVLAWYLESEGFELDGEIELTAANNTFTVTACLPADCYSLTFETPGGILNALAASISISVNGAIVSLTDWPEDAAAYTIEFGVMEDCGDSVTEKGLNESLSVYPNPSNGQFTLTSDDRWTGATAIVTDATGREVNAFRIGGAISVINLDNMANGMYFLRLMHEGMTETLKLNVQK